MIELYHADDDAYLRLIPNRSATWRQTQVAVAILGVITLSIAAAWSVLGFWLILPFAGLELALLYYLAWQVCSATYHQQVVLVSEDEIELQWGLRFPKKRWVFNRKKAELEVVRPRHSLSPHHLFLKDDQQRVAVAENLSADDVKLAMECFRAIHLPLKFCGSTSTVAAKAPQLENAAQT